jgi:hypothetical protein
MRNTIFSDVTPFSPVVHFPCRTIFSDVKTWRWTSTGLHSVASQNTVLFTATAVKTSSPIRIFDCAGYEWQITAAAQLKANIEIMGSNPTWSMDVYVRLFCDCAVLCVQVSALQRADPPSKESHRMCKRSINWKTVKAQKKGCRAIDR